MKVENAKFGHKHVYVLLLLHTNFCPFIKSLSFAVIGALHKGGINSSAFRHERELSR
jgi:hypothetical protein